MRIECSIKYLFSEGANIEGSAPTNEARWSHRSYHSALMKGATEETFKQLGNEIVTYLKQVGFSNIRMEFKKMKPVTAFVYL